MRKAHWVRQTHLFRPDEYLCSACGSSSAAPAARCPFCGAPMKGRRVDPSWVDEAEGLSAMLDDDW